MVVNKTELISISVLELLAFYIYDNDMFKLMSFKEFGKKFKAQGVKIV